jgi:hypothetical protein
MRWPGKTIACRADVSKLHTVEAEVRKIAVTDPRNRNVACIAWVGATFHARVIMSMLMRAIEYFGPNRGGKHRFFDTDAEALAWIAAERVRLELEGILWWNVYRLRHEQSAKRTVCIARFALGGVRHRNGSPKCIDFGLRVLKQRVGRINDKPVVTRRGRRVPRRRMPNLAPDGIVFEDVVQQLIVRRSFRGRDGAFYHFAAQAIVHEDLHTPQGCLTFGRWAMQKRPNGPAKAIENRFVVVGAVCLGVLEQRASISMKRTSPLGSGVVLARNGCAH